MKRKLWTAALTAVTSICIACGVSACARERRQVWTADSAYAKAQELGYEGELEEFLEMLRGADGQDGRGITDVELSDEGELVIVYSDGQRETIGSATGAKGDTGPQGPQGEKGETGDAGPQGPQGEKGETGDTGPQGPQGEKGETGDVGPQGPQGEKGETGDAGPQGPQGEKGDPGEKGENGKDGENGKSAYEIWQEQGHEGSEAEFLEWLRGESAYKVWLEQGHEGSEAEFLDWLRGKSAYEIWLEQGHKGSENDFLEWLRKQSEQTVTPEGTEGLLYRTKRSADGDYLVVAGLGSAWEADIVVPATVHGLPVKEIGYGAFNDAIGEHMRSFITSVSLPESITLIEEEAFFGCSFLERVTIAEGSELSYIGERAFSGCSSLSSIDLPKKLTDIGAGAFEGCGSLKEVNVEDIGAWCAVRFGDEAANPLTASHRLFSGGKEIVDLRVPDGVTSIASFAFEGCEYIRNVVIPESVTLIERNAFSDCSALSKVYFGGTLWGWEEISVGENNDSFQSAVRSYFSFNDPDDAQWSESEEWWHYDETGAVEEYHRHFDGDGDGACDVCEKKMNADEALS